jgi:Macrocin-O-methyltransferase (TylF)
MGDFKTFLVNIKGFFKQKTPWQVVRNNSFLQQIFGVRFKFGFIKSRSNFKAYIPDSFFVFSQHPEMEELLKKFTANNKWNNGGDVTRLFSFILNCKQILAEKINGDFAELGVWRGNTAAVLAHYAFEQNRKLFLFDTFEGFNTADLKGVDAKKTIAFNNTSIQLVKNNMGKNDSACEYVKGFFPDTLTQIHHDRQYAIVSLDCDLYAPTKAALFFFYDKMPVGAIFFLHDYSSLHWEGSKLAIDEFCKEKNEYVILMPDKSGSAFLRKSKS